MPLARKIETPLIAMPIAIPFSSVLRLPGSVGVVRGVPARRASTRAAISLSTFSRNDATTASLYSEPELMVRLGGGANLFWGQRRSTHTGETNFHCCVRDPCHTQKYQRDALCGHNQQRPAGNSIPGRAFRAPGTALRAGKT